MFLFSSVEFVATKEVLRTQFRVLYALMMHDIKSRFFGSGIGYAVTILWPLSHIAVILAINAGKIVPYGSSMILYAATAAIPFVACNYIARFIMMGVLMNKNFLQYPIIRPLDMLFARAILEVINNLIVVCILMAGMSLLGIDIEPNNVIQAIAAWFTSMLLGISIGLLGGIVCLAFPLFNLLFVLLTIVIWSTCGIGLNPEFLPDQIAYYFSFNPVMHCVEWMRQAYYLGSPSRLLDKTYVFEVSAFCLTLGLVLERLFRAFLLSPR